MSVIPGATAPYGTILDKTGETGTPPKAYLNYITFDSDFNPILSKSGFIRMTTAAREDGSGVAHERLARTTPLSIEEPGYVYIYLSNEDDSYEVFFDDFKVEQVHSPVVQMDDYYPFGLTFNSYLRESSVKNRYLYNQGSGDKKFLTERVFDLGLNVDFSRYRVYDPAMGRWWQVDPLADLDELVTWTPYNYGYNNPVLNNDPEGDCFPCLIVLEKVAEVAVFLVGSAVIIENREAITEHAKSTVRMLNEGMRNASPYSTPAVDAAQSAGGPKSLNADSKRSASDQKLIDQAKQQKAKKDAAKARTQSRQQQTQQGKQKEGKSNQETRGSHNSGSRNSGDKHSKANERRAREQAKADQKKEESKKKN